MRWKFPLATVVLAIALALVSKGNAQSVATPVETAFASLGNHLTIAYAYDPESASPWKAYDPKAPSFANQLKEVEPLGGYFVYVDQDVDFTVGPPLQAAKKGLEPGGVARGSNNEPGSAGHAAGASYAHSNAQSYSRCSPYERICNYITATQYGRYQYSRGSVRFRC